MSQELKELRSRLESMDKELKNLLEITELDLKFAKELQKRLIPNRLPQLTGIQCVARYVSAQQMSCETFDVFATHDNRYVWVLLSFTETFGLSSVLLQALNHIQSRAVAHELDPNGNALFFEIAKNFSTAKKNGNFRLSLMKLDTHSLKGEWTSLGMPPPLVRESVRNSWSPWKVLFLERLQNQKDALQAQLSSEPIDAKKVFHEHFQLSPGQRFFILGSFWNPTHQISEFMKPLKLEKTGHLDQSDLVDDMNYLLMREQDHIQAHKIDADLDVIALEVDAKRLHLA